MSRNLSIVVDSEFKNRSFDDLLRPLALYTAEYNAQEEALGDLATKANVWEGMADQEKDPIAYAQYKRYADSLRNQAKLLSSAGLNPSSKMDLLNLKRRYASEIAPIEQAYASRKAQADEQRKALLQNPTLLLSRRADMTSLDDYLKNQQLGYESYSGALLTQQVSQAAKAIAKELKAYGNGKRLDAFTKTWLQQHGVTSAEVAYAINHPDSPKSNKVLNTIVANVMSDSGIANWADRATLKEAYSYARQGLWDAVGQTEVREYKDTGAEIAAREASQKRVAAHAAALQNKATDVSLPAVVPTPLFNPKDNAKNIELYNKYRKYFTTDAKGVTRLNEEGRKEYFKKYKDIKQNYNYKTLQWDRKVEEHPSDFKLFVDNTLKGAKYMGVPYMDNPKKEGSIFDRLSLSNVGLVVPKEVSKGDSWKGIQPGNVGNLWNQYIAGNVVGDATRSTEYIYRPHTDTEAENLLTSIAAAANNRDVNVVEFDGKTFKPTGDTFNSSDFLNSSDKKKWRLVDLRMSSYDIDGSKNKGTFKVADPSGKIWRLEMPRGVNFRAEGNRDAKLAELQFLEESLMNHTYVDAGGNSIPIPPGSPLEVALQDRYKRALSEAHFYESQLDVRNTTKKQEWELKGY